MAWWSKWDNPALGYFTDIGMDFGISDHLWLGLYSFMGVWDLDFEAEFRSAYWGGGLAVSYQPFEVFEIGIKADLGLRRIGYSKNHRYLEDMLDYNGMLFLRIWWLKLNR